MAVFTAMGSAYRTLRAELVLRDNIRALLSRNHQTAEALSLWCRHKPPWMSKVLSGERNIVIPDLHRIADFFGVEIGDLFRPGASSLTERRRAERRSGQDRRTGQDRRGAPLNLGDEATQENASKPISYQTAHSAPGPSRRS